MEKGFLFRLTVWEVAVEGQPCHRWSGQPLRPGELVCAGRFPWGARRQEQQVAAVKAFITKTHHSKSTFPMTLGPQTRHIPWT